MRRSSREAATGRLPVGYVRADALRVGRLKLAFRILGPLEVDVAVRADPPRRPAAALGAGDPAARRESGRVDRPPRGRALRRGAAGQRRHADAPADLGAASPAGAGSRAGRGRRADRDAAARLPHPGARRTRSISAIFERRAEAAGSALAAGDAEAAVRLYREALALWRGEPLADLAFEPFARPVVERLSELRLAVTEQCLDAELELGRGAELVPELERLVTRASAQRAPARAADGRALPRRPAARGARGVPRRARRPRRGVRARAHARAEGARGARAAAGPRARRREPRAARAARGRSAAPCCSRRGTARQLDGLVAVGRVPRRARPARAADHAGRRERGVARRRRRRDARAA